MKGAKVRRMWTDDDQIYFKSGGPGETLSGISVRNPVLVLKWDKASRDALVEKVARALHGGSWTFDVGPDSSRDAYYDDARAALSAVFGKGGKP